MPQVNEQLDKLWSNDIPEDTNINAEGLKLGLVKAEVADGVNNAGVHQVDNKGASCLK